MQDSPFGWFGLGVVCVIGALTPGMSRLRAGVLWASAAAFFGICVWQLEPWRGLSLTWVDLYAAAGPIVVVGVVALMLRASRRFSRPREGVQDVGLSAPEIEALVDKRILENSSTTLPDVSREWELATKEVAKAVQALVEPIKAREDLARLQSVRIPDIPQEGRFSASEGKAGRALELATEGLTKTSRRIDDAEAEVARITGRPRLTDRMKQAEDKVRQDARFISQLREDPIEWASGEIKQRWHMVRARREVLEREIKAISAELERRAEAQTGRAVKLLESALRKLGPD